MKTEYSNQRSKRMGRRSIGVYILMLIPLMFLLHVIPVNGQQPAGEYLLEYGVVTVGNDFTTVHLKNTYINPVSVCSVHYQNNTLPVIARVKDVISDSFRIQLVNPSGSDVVEDDVSYLVVEEGVWNIDGVKIEAQTYLSTVTDEDGSWTGELQTYGQSYTSPVVLGQVMTSNDPNWSVFWCQGSTRTNPPSTSALRTGKTVCEDNDTTRADETIGFIVFEAGHGVINGVEFEAALGPDTIMGIGDSPPYSYSFRSAFDSEPQVVLTTMAGVDGANGGWAYPYGYSIVTDTSLNLAIDEDQIRDSERNHISEQVAYVTFGPQPIANEAPLAVDDAYIIGPDGSLFVGAPGVLTNDLDPEGDLLTAEIVTPPRKGESCPKFGRFFFIQYF